MLLTQQLINQFYKYEGHHKYEGLFQSNLYLFLWWVFPHSHHCCLANRCIICLLKQTDSSAVFFLWSLSHNKKNCYLQTKTFVIVPPHKYGKLYRISGQCFCQVTNERTVLLLCIFFTLMTIGNKPSLNMLKYEKEDSWLDTE